MPFSNISDSFQDYMLIYDGPKLSPNRLFNPFSNISDSSQDYMLLYDDPKLSAKRLFNQVWCWKKVFLHINTTEAFIMPKR